MKGVVPERVGLERDTGLGDGGVVGPCYKRDMKTLGRLKFIS